MAEKRRLADEELIRKTIPPLKERPDQFEFDDFDDDAVEHPINLQEQHQEDQEFINQ